MKPTLQSITMLAVVADNLAKKADPIDISSTIRTSTQAKNILRKWNKNIVTTMSNIDIVIGLDIPSNSAISNVEMNANPTTLQKKNSSISISAILNIRTLTIITMKITINIQRWRW